MASQRVDCRSETARVVQRTWRVEVGLKEDPPEIDLQLLLQRGWCNVATRTADREVTRDKVGLDEETVAHDACRFSEPAR